MKCLINVFKVKEKLWNCSKVQWLLMKQAMVLFIFGCLFLLSCKPSSHIPSSVEKSSTSIPVSALLSERLGQNYQCRSNSSSTYSACFSAVNKDVSVPERARLLIIIDTQTSEVLHENRLLMSHVTWKSEYVVEIFKHLGVNDMRKNNKSSYLFNVLKKELVPHADKELLTSE